MTFWREAPGLGGVGAAIVSWCRDTSKASRSSRQQGRKSGNEQARQQAKKAKVNLACRTSASTERFAKKATAKFFGK